MREKCSINISDESYILIKVPLQSICLDELVKSFYMLDDRLSLDDLTFKMMKDFSIYGFTESRVKNAKKVDSENNMVIYFDYAAVGLTVCFDGKFYSIGIKGSNLSEEKLYSIYMNSNFNKK